MWVRERKRPSFNDDFARVCLGFARRGAVPLVSCVRLVQQKGRKRISKSSILRRIELRIARGMAGRFTTVDCGEQLEAFNSRHEGSYQSSR